MTSFSGFLDGEEAYLNSLDTEGFKRVWTDGCPGDQQREQQMRSN